LSKEFCHLLDTTWALIVHERFASIDKRFGLFSRENPLAGSSLVQRIDTYAAFGKRLDLFHPDESAASLVLELEKGRII
jgi:hypothetical protein